MSLPLKKEKFTYADYLTWPDDERWELINGVPHNMSPAPSRKHQEIIGELYTRINVYLRDKECKVYLAPFDVVLPTKDSSQDEKIENVVQPDIAVICNMTKLTDKGCTGAPDLVVEVLSPGTVKKDRNEKFRLYEQVGVKEYWIADPLHETIEVYLLVNGKYNYLQTYVKEDELKVNIFDDLVIDLKPIFKD